MGSPRRAGARGRDARRSRLRVVVGAVVAALAIGVLGASPGLAASPGNDGFRAAQPVDLASAITMDTQGATVEAKEPDPSCNRSAGASVWFSFTPEADGRYAVDTFQSGYDTTVAVYRGRWLPTLRQVSCSDDAGGLTSYAMFKGRAGVTYRIQVSGDRGAAGELLLSVGYAPDLTPPHVAAPVPGFRVGARLGASGVARWSAWDRQSGVQGFELELARASDPWAPVPLGAPRARAARIPLLDGVETHLRLRAANHQAMVSDWATAPAFVANIVEEDHPTIDRSAGWMRRTSAAASGGGTIRSVRPGARLTYAFVGRSVAVVAPRGPRRGALRVFIDGELARTVDLGRDTRQTKRVVFSETFRDVAPHEITIEVVGTADRPRVDVDAILTAVEVDR